MDMTEAEKTLRREIAQLGIEMCFDTDIDYELGRQLIDLFTLNFPDHYNNGLSYWKRKYESLATCESVAQLSNILDDWMFTKEGRRAGETNSEIALMTARLFINASRNVLWNFNKEGILLNQQVKNKFQALRLILDDLCSVRGLNILTMLS